MLKYWAWFNDVSGGSAYFYPKNIESLTMKTDVLFQMLSDILFLQPLDKFLKQYPATKYLYVYDCKTNCSDLGSNGCYKDEYGKLKLCRILEVKKISIWWHICKFRKVELWPQICVHRFVKSLEVWIKSEEKRENFIYEKIAETVAQVLRYAEFKIDGPHFK